MTLLSTPFGSGEGSQATEPSAEASALIAQLGQRDDAIGELAELGDRGAVEPLIALMGSGDNRARYAATVVLGRLGDQRAVEPLAGQLSDPEPFLRKTAAWALGFLGDRSAVPPLIAALSDPHEDVRHDVAEALGCLGDSRAVEPLQRLQRDTDWVRRAAAEALKEITGAE